MAEAIKVAVRIRPFVPKEVDAGASTAIAVHGNAVTVNTGSQTRTFGCDHVYWSVDPKHPDYASQDTVNAEIGRPCFENMLKGYNFCVFAYGQTGSGKTHTLSCGSREKHVGLIPWVLEGLFTQHRAKFKSDELRIWISYMEIYNERMRDLLSPGRQTSDLKVIDHPELGAYVPGLTEAPCREMDEWKKLMDFGTKKRVTAATNMNASSSRSHAVFTIRAQRLSGPKPTGNKSDHRKSLSSRVNLVDLAGSERIARSGAEGLRLREGCAINQSLTALGLVIKQLSEIQREGRPRGRSAYEERMKAIPFRASKLTFLLRDSLAGNSRTFMIAAISPASTASHESISTLRFASSVKRVKTVAMQNVDKKDELVASLQAEVIRLSELLGSAASGAAEANLRHLHDDLAERERLLSELTKSHAQQLAEAKLLQGAREEVMKDMGLTQQDLAQTMGIDKDLPCLINMNEDPSLAGKIVYFLPPLQPISIGAHKDNKIVLQGLGMPDYLCRVENLGDQGVVVSTHQTAPHEARVCINGSALKGQRKLKHHDKLFLGRASALRLILPEAARAVGQAGSLLPISERDAELLRAIVPEDSRAWAELQLYLEDLRERLGEESGQEIFETLIQASNLVDEANEITEALRPEDRLKFEVELVWDIHRAARDVVVIRLMRTICPAEEEESPCSRVSDVDKSVVVAYWTLAKFKARLDQMRDCFDSKQTSGRWDGRGDCLDDPWMEPSLGELRHRLVAHIDIESQRRFGSKTSVLTLRPVEGSRTAQGASKDSRKVGSKYSMASLETVSSTASKVMGMPPPPVRRQPMARLTSRGTERDTSPAHKAQVPPSSSSSNQGASFVTSAGSEEFGNSITAAAGSSLKDELNESMRAQLREKEEKEELYQLRIEYLQQQIYLYRQYTRTGTSSANSPLVARPLPAVDDIPRQSQAYYAHQPGRELSRARSASPGPEPRTAEAASPVSSRRGPCTARSMSAREVRHGASLEIVMAPKSPSSTAANEPISVTAGQVIHGISSAETVMPFSGISSAETIMPSLLTSGTAVRSVPPQVKAWQVRRSPLPESKAAVVRYVAAAGQEPRASGHAIFMAGHTVSAARLLQLARPGSPQVPMPLADQATRGRSVGREPRSLSPVVGVTHHSPER